MAFCDCLLVVARLIAPVPRPSEANDVTAGETAAEAKILSQNSHLLPNDFQISNHILSIGVRSVGLACSFTLVDMESLKLWWLEFTGQHSKSATIAENGQTSLHATQVASKPVQLPPRRRVFVNLPLPDDFLDGAGIPTTHYLPNKIKTSKYNVVNFIPKNLWEQFHRIANGMSGSRMKALIFSEHSNTVSRKCSFWQWRCPRCLPCSR